MKRFYIFITLVFAGLYTGAQDYTKSVGLRGGISSGFEYRFFTDDANSYKILLSTRDRGIQLHAFKEFHQYQLFNFTDQLVFYFGAGVHTGFQSWDEVRVRDHIKWYDTKTRIIAGLDGLAGLDYVFYEVPISIGVEVKPYFDLFGRDMFKLQLFDFAFTVRYLF